MQEEIKFKSALNELKKELEDDQENFRKITAENEDKIKLL